MSVNQLLLRSYLPPSSGCVACGCELHGPRRWVASESGPRETKDEIDKLSLRRARRVSVTQRLTSMLPSEYLEDNLDSESRSVIDSLSDSSKENEKSSASPPRLPPPAPPLVSTDTAAELSVRGDAVMEAKDERVPFQVGDLVSVHLISGSTTSSGNSPRSLFGSRSFALHEAPSHTEIGTTDLSDCDLARRLSPGILASKPGDVVRVSDDDNNDNNSRQTAWIVPRRMTLDDYLGWSSSRQKIEEGKKTTLRISPQQVPTIANFLEIQSGHDVLEVGTDSGVTCLKLAQLVGPRGSVTSLDRSSDRINAARRVIEEWRRHDEGRDERRKGNPRQENHAEISYKIRALVCDASCDGDLKSMVPLSLMSQDAILTAIANPGTVVVNVLPYLKIGSCFGFVTHDFSAIVDFCDDLVRREIPLIPEAVHRFFDDVCDLSAGALHGSISDLTASAAFPALLPVYVLKARRVMNLPGASPK